jgi:hypothetical protein
MIVSGGLSTIAGITFLAASGMDDAHLATVAATWRWERCSTCSGRTAAGPPRERLNERPTPSRPQNQNHVYPPPSSPGRARRARRPRPRIVRSRDDRQRPRSTTPSRRSCSGTAPSSTRRASTESSTHCAATAARRRRKRVQWVSKVISALLRSRFAQSIAGHTPRGEVTDSFVPATEEADPRDRSAVSCATDTSPACAVHARRRWRARTTPAGSAACRG